MNIELQIHDDVLLLFPELRTFRMTVEGVSLTPALSALAGVRLAEAIAHLKQAVPTAEDLTGQQAVIEWRDAYTAMGVKPAAHRCSFEALARRAIAGKPLETGVPTVDLYNAASIRHMACLGAYDTRRLECAPLELRSCRPHEDRFAPLGGRAEDMPLRPRLVVYAQGAEVLCWGLNHRDSEKACLRPDTIDMVIMAEAVTPRHADNARRALDALHDDLRQLGFRTSHVVETCGNLALEVAKVGHVREPVEINFA